MFELDNNNTLFYLNLENNTRAPYIEPTFRWDLLEYAHNNYGHFGPPGIQGILDTRGWWPSITKDCKTYVQYCPQCQLHQKQRTPARPEPTFHQVKKLLPFQRWALDVVGLLLKTVARNQYIITGIDYATSWPVAYATLN